MPNTKEAWEKLPKVTALQSGDVLIKHVWGVKDGGTGRGGTELMIRLANAMHVFDTKGSQSAEHAAMVGCVNGRPRLFEAVGEGILTQKEGVAETLRLETAYTVFRRKPDDGKTRGFQMLCDGMATRLAQLQGEPVLNVNLPLYENVPAEQKLRDAVANAHFKAILLLKPAQSTRYGFGNMATMALPNLIPDSLWSKHDQRVIKFIKGDLDKIAYICSGLVAAMLQAWSVVYYAKRVFNDPAQIHPTGLEHHFLKNSFEGFERVGTWGLGRGHTKAGAVTAHIRGG